VQYSDMDEELLDDRANGVSTNGVRRVHMGTPDGKQSAAQLLVIALARPELSALREEAVSEYRAGCPAGLPAEGCAPTAAHLFRV